jgi:flagellin
MASIINTNITSLVAQNNLSMTQAHLQTTIERLSSGLRVNSAADDASGFAIANRMDAQIRGMAVATRNANDGISFSQTTTGALSQISNNLQRMRELAVQAANGSNSASDTQLLNQEFNQLQTEVGRIQSSTKFNNVSVFQANDIVFQVGANTSSGDRVNMQSTPLSSTSGVATTTITDSDNLVPWHNIADAVANTSATATALGGNDATKIAYINNATVDAINSNQKLSFAAKNDLLNTLGAINKAYGSSGVSGNTAANFYTDITKVVGSVDALGVYTAPTSPTGVNLTTSISLTIVATTAGPALPATGTTFTADELGTNPLILAAGGNGLSINANSVSVGNGTIQAGSLRYGVTTAATTSAGQANSLVAISAIDTALTEVNKASAIQGALQNRFSAVISNLTAFSQSQTAAKSRIVDADFAAETAKLSKNQILQQAGTAMLAQANQLPSGILSLLKNG